MSRNKQLLRVLTNSERGTFACQRRWWFRYEQGLTIYSPAVLRQGTLFHRCLAAWYHSNMELTWNAVCDAVIDPWLEQRSTWAHAGNDDEDTVVRMDQLEEDDQLATTVRAMVQGYIHTWGKHDRERWEIVNVEGQVARWLRNPKGITKRAGGIFDQIDPETRQRRQWAYGGALDLLVRDKHDGTHWLVEHKGTRETDLVKYMRKLAWDSQTRGYAWTLKRPIAAVSDIKDPVHVMGVIYNVARSKAPNVPKLVDKGARLSKAACDTTRDVFLATIQEHGFDPDDYADMLDKLAGKKFFHRDTYVFTEDELDEWGQDAAWAAVQVRDQTKRPHHTRQATQCHSFGRDCEFMGICTNDGPLARRSYNVASFRHDELTSDMAEPYMGRMRGLGDATPARVSLIDDPLADD